MSVQSDPLPQVSIVIPAYNRASSIRIAVESVLRQTFTDFELLVVDDGSTDGTMEALEGVTDPRLKRLANPRNMGASAARNTGIRAARAEWVAFHDSDDEWLPLKLEKQMARLAMAAEGTVACYCGLAIVGRGELVRQRLRRSKRRSTTTVRTDLRYVPASNITTVEGDVRASLLRWSLASTQTLVARRDALERVGGFDEAMPALLDWDCVIRLAQLGPFAFVDEPLVLQYFSENSITRSVRKRVVARRMMLEKHAALYAPHPALLSLQWVKIAGEHRSLGDQAEARAALAEAARLDPLNIMIWLRRLRLLWPRRKN